MDKRKEIREAQKRGERKEGDEMRERYRILVILEVNKRRG